MERTNEQTPKHYRFDYIKEDVDKWNPQIPRDYYTISFLPFGLLLTTPIRDYYGEEVDDAQEWLRQRDEYIKKLVERYKNR